MDKEMTTDKEAEETTRIQLALRRNIILFSAVPLIILFCFLIVFVLWAFFFSLFASIIVIPFAVLTSLIDILWVIYQWVTGIKDIKTIKEWDVLMMYEDTLSGRTFHKVMNMHKEFADKILDFVLSLIFKR